MEYSKEKALEENAKHICPYTKSPCLSLACGVRSSGVCNILEVAKHDPSDIDKMIKAVTTTHFIQCSKCDNSSQSLLLERETAISFYYQGWRMPNEKMYCPSCFLKIDLPAEQSSKESEGLWEDLEETIYRAMQHGTSAGTLTAFLKSKYKIERL